MPTSTLTNFPGGITSFGMPVVGGSGAMLDQIGDGQVFFVDPGNGSDGNDGKSPERAFAGLATAIGQCVANRGDVIFRLPGTETISSPITFNKQGITVMAVAYGHPNAVRGESFMTYNNSATGLSAAKILDPCRLVGLGFAASDVSEEALLIDCEEQGGFNGGFNSIEYCRFPLWNGSLACSIRMIGGANNRVTGCVFDGLFVGWATAAIMLQGDTGGFTSFYPRVLGCHFERLGSGKAAIEHVAGSAPDEVLYAHNYLGSEGVFLNNNSEAADGLACDNWLGLANQAAAFTNMTNSNIKLVDNHYNE